MVVLSGTNGALSGSVVAMSGTVVALSGSVVALVFKILKPTYVTDQNLLVASNKFMSLNQCCSLC